MEEEKIKQLIIESCLKLAHKGEGALIIFNGSPEYDLMLEQNVKPFNIEGNAKLLESLAIIDGAVIINKEGVIIAYGARIKNKIIVSGYGTRHQAAASASMTKDSLAFLVSEEEKKLKVYNDGVVIMQIDGLQKGIENQTSEIAKIVQSFAGGALGVWGMSALATGTLTMGLVMIPGVIVFGSAAYLARKIFEGNVNGK